MKEIVTIVVEFDTSFHAKMRDFHHDCWHGCLLYQLDGQQRVSQKGDLSHQ